APMGGSFAPVRVAAFKWNGWQTSAVYARCQGAHFVGPLESSATLDDIRHTVVAAEQGWRQAMAKWADQATQ
ncbi:hypothetical protein, partial [Parahaliea aestuarii]